jgi:hypothetical protein
VNTVPLYCTLPSGSKISLIGRYRYSRRSNASNGNRETRLTLEAQMRPAISSIMPLHVDFHHRFRQEVLSGDED